MVPCVTVDKFKFRDFIHICQKISLSILRQRTVKFRIAAVLTEIGGNGNYAVFSNGIERRLFRQLQSFTHKRIIERLGVCARWLFYRQINLRIVPLIDGLIICLHIYGIIALAVKHTSVKTQPAPAGGKMCGVGIG